MTQIEWDPQAEVRCVHVEQCGACPLMSSRYDAQCNTKLTRLRRALDRYDLKPEEKFASIRRAEAIQGYRRRAKLVVAAHPGGGVSVGLYRRHDNQHVVDIPECQVLRPELMALVAEIRTLVADPPEELAALMVPSGDGKGVLTGIDARSLKPPAEPDGTEEACILLTLILAAERTRPMEEMREAARALRRRIPSLAGISLSMRYSARHHASSELMSVSGVAEAKDRVGSCYQLVSHTSFLHVHREQAEGLYALLNKITKEVMPEKGGRVLDLYGGTGAIALSLAAAGHPATLVESYPPAAALALRAAQAQRLPVEVVTGDVASVSNALAAAGSKFEVVVANPPRRGLSPAAREAIAALSPSSIVYVACDLNNLSRDLDHLARLGFSLSELHPLDMLPLTEEVEVVAVLSRGVKPRPSVLFEDQEIIVFNKPAHEPVHDQDEYPVSLVSRAREHLDGGDWITVLKVEAGTSGVCVMARDERAAGLWRQSLADNGRLVYLAAARGVTPAKGAITRELRGEEGERRPARTRYRRLAIGGGHSVLRVVPEKRHTHQIRRHLAAIGHPVLGDARYGHGPTNRYFEEKHGLDRSFLHLVRIEVDHPRSGARMLIEAPLPADLRAALVRASDESVLRFLQNKKALGGQGVRFRDGHGTGPMSGPLSERSPLSVNTGDVDSAYPSARAPLTQRSPGAIELDEAPRTVRGELLTPDDDDSR